MSSLFAQQGRWAVLGPSAGWILPVLPIWCPELARQGPIQPHGEEGIAWSDLNMGAWPSQTPAWPPGEGRVWPGPNPALVEGGGGIWKWGSIASAPLLPNFLTCRKSHGPDALTLGAVSGPQVIEHPDLNKQKIPCIRSSEKLLFNMLSLVKHTKLFSRFNWH